jgi:hypothetical protein
MKIFCWLGLHDWLHYGEVYSMRVCRNCQKEQYLGSVEKWKDTGTK